MKYTENPVCWTWLFQIDFSEITYRSTGGRARTYVDVIVFVFSSGLWNFQSNKWCIRLECSHTRKQDSSFCTNFIRLWLLGSFFRIPKQKDPSNHNHIKSVQKLESCFLVRLHSNLMHHLLLWKFQRPLEKTNTIIST